MLTNAFSRSLCGGESGGEVSRNLRCWVEISRQRLVENYERLKRTVGPRVEIMPVVKADAYRHGAVEVSRTLLGAGVRWLAVSSVDEGVALRRAQIDARILVMGGILPWEWETIRSYELTPVLHSLEEIGKVGPGRYHLKIDSGMGRLGTRAEVPQLASAIRQAPHAKLEGLMTHFASSADFTSNQTELQIQRFEEIRQGLQAEGVVAEYVHMASTNSLVLARSETWWNLVRPGLVLYGYWTKGRGAAPKPLVETRPVLCWKASIVAVKEIEQGAPVGYGAMFRAPRDMRIAVVGIGYADGLPHRLSNRGRVIAAGKLTPVLGAVSMDLTTIDLTPAPHLKVGDAVTIIGEEGEVCQDAHQLARAAGTITYDILCSISARVQRVYL
ncbi:MAG: alanine racemase [Bryobacteraceae bacterium]|nr:alanine racemase [Bryobacteraceae bacterium]MDW8378065.1 alanine racemase [Bryobacterales bacterium]